METIEILSVEELEDGTFGVYNESGQCVEADFKSEIEAETWVIDNGYELY